MSRYGPDFFRELLVADLAIEKGADPERVGSAMARFLDTGDREELNDIGSSVTVELEAALSKANGDAKVALASRGGLDRSMLQSVPALTSSGVRARAELRSLDPARYVDLQEIGRGGMGVVYLAYDTDLNRHVALKFVRTGADADPLSDVLFADPAEGHARFLQEAWVTGGLEHPGVVPVYELGKTELGAPYYAMRVVRGERTLEDAILQARGLEDRLALLEPFLKVCDTVRYAHGRGVIHRDLKPSNVALGEYGEVVLLDWGLAKVKEHPDFAESRWHDRLQEMRAETNLQTLEGAVGTPGFMALEALTGELDRVDERSDVYSLGVTLYRVLTREMPYGEVGLGELSKRMRAGLPPSPREVDPAIPEGLVRICMKALATDRDGRYGDAGQLADAVRRWQRESALDREVGAMLSEAESGLTAAQALEGDALLSQVDRVLAVTARILELKPEQAEAKRIEADARKRRATAMEANAHATRRRLLVRVGAAGLAAAAAIAVIVAVLLDAKRREAEGARGREQASRVRAETERGRAEDLSAFMLVELREKLEPLGRLDLLGSVARKSLDYQRSLPARELTAKDWRSRGLALASLGDVLVESGDPASALQCYEDALAIQRRHAADHPAEPAWQRAVAVSLERITDVHIQQGDLDAALASSGESLEIKRRLASGSSDAESRQDLAVGLDKLGYVKVLHGDLDAAQAAYEEGLELRERLVAERPEEAVLQRDLSVSLNELGEVRWRRRDYAAALGNYVRSVKIRRRLVASDDANAGLQRDLFVSLVRLGRAQLQLEKTAGAQASGREALRVSQHLAQADPTNTRWQQDVSLARELVGDAQAAGGDLDGALGSLRESLAIREQLAAADPTNVERQRNLAVNHDSIGKLHGLREDASAALASFKKSFDITERIAKRDPSNLNLQRDLYVTLASMAGAHEVAGDLEQASRALQQSVDRCRTLVAEAPHLRRELDILAKEHRKLVLLAGLKAPEGPADHLLLGRARYDRKEFAQAAEHFAEALKDQALRTDLNEGALYDAACTAALAGMEAWRNRALGWLAEDVRLRRKRIDEVTAELGQDPSKERRTQLEALRAQSVRHLEHARAKDPDLATLRGTEAFERIFDPSRR